MSSAHSFLILGDGAREDALAARLAECSMVGAVRRARARWGPAFASEEEGFAWARGRGAIVLAGPEDLLAGGLADRARASGLSAVGPSAAGARLEASKAFGRRIARRAGIPVPEGRILMTTPAEIRGVALAQPLPFVLKADGLFGGKGSFVCRSREDVEAALACLLPRGAPIHLEEFLPGTEFSAFVGVAPNGLVWLGSARDYKRLLRGDEGPMTGGMGAYSPHPREAQIRGLALDWAARSVAAMRQEGISYDGILYLGGAFTNQGAVLYEYNVRFGDPETQAIAGRITPAGFAETIACLAHGEAVDPEWNSETCVAVVLATRGYPENPAFSPFPIPPGRENDRSVILGGDTGRVATIVGSSSTLVLARRACGYLYGEIVPEWNYTYRDDIGSETEEDHSPRRG